MDFNERSLGSQTIQLKTEPEDEDSPLNTATELQLQPSQPRTLDNITCYDVDGLKYNQDGSDDDPVFGELANTETLLDSVANVAMMEHHQRQSSESDTRMSISQKNNDPVFGELLNTETLLDNVNVVNVTMMEHHQRQSSESDTRMSNSQKNNGRLDQLITSRISKISNSTAPKRRSAAKSGVIQQNKSLYNQLRTSSANPIGFQNAKWAQEKWQQCPNASLAQGLKSESSPFCIQQQQHISQGIGAQQIHQRKSTCGPETNAQNQAPTPTPQNSSNSNGTENLNFNRSHGSNCQDKHGSCTHNPTAHGYCGETGDFQGIFSQIPGAYQFHERQDASVGAVFREQKRLSILRTMNTLMAQIDALLNEDHQSRLTIRNLQTLNKSLSTQVYKHRRENGLLRTVISRFGVNSQYNRMVTSISTRAFGPMGGSQGLAGMMRGPAGSNSNGTMGGTTGSNSNGTMGGTTFNNSNGTMGGTTGSNSNGTMGGTTFTNSNGTMGGVAFTNSNGTMGGAAFTNSNGTMGGVAFNNSNGTMGGAACSNSNATMIASAFNNSNGTMEGAACNNSNDTMIGSPFSNSTGMGDAGFFNN